MKPGHRIFCLFALLVAATAFADGPGPGPGHHPPPPGLIADRLELDDRQRELFTALMESRREHRLQQQQARKEMRQLVEAESLDQAAVAALAARMADEVEEQIVETAQLMHDFHFSLTAAQREKLVRLAELRAQRGPGDTPDWFAPEPPEGE